MPQNASIQSYFSSSPSKASAPGDGFTSEEVDAVLHPPSAQWTPTQDYEEVSIGAIDAGPRNLTFMGRIVNYHDNVKPSKRPQAAQGCLKLMVADDTGAVTVRLWYAKALYQVRLGQLVTVWTVHVSHGEQASLAPSVAPLFTSIFPERERSCYFMVHENSDDGTMFKRPFGCRDKQALPGLMTLKSFTNGGYDVEECKLLVCAKSIGARKKFTNKNGTTSDLMSILVFDDTAEASLTLYGSICTSASSWQPSSTILLLSHPGWRIDRLAKLSLTANTRVDIDPDIADARWLRALAHRLNKKEHVNPSFPTAVFDTATAETAPVRILYTLAELDACARTNPAEPFTGYLSVVLTQLHIVSAAKRNMLLSSSCCGLPVFANAATAPCKQCDAPLALRINPRILGAVVDETGQIGCGKLVLSDAAWLQLLGRTAEQLVATDVNVLEYLEQRLLFLRVSLGFGVWIEDGVGRLAAWCVKM
ncbi:hypothetical protein BDV95DRAFT_540811 [Massariosphaeria phaeospora]|uniref:Nucleic acid-binding protein n=1 Tax=Massariosphaeria phaeospora TaxID=100035 RepID=A0A7C8IGF3_9PLEO|nr:hypothetical protein BDV95DRAFT_540811 [Massariosphaeria phaeospora]